MQSLLIKILTNGTSPLFLCPESARDPLERIRFACRSLEGAADTVNAFVDRHLSFRPGSKLQ